MIRIIQQALDEKGDLPTPARSLAPDANLYRAGLTPFAAVKVMLQLEQELKIEFPKRMLKCRSMSSISAINAQIRDLQGAQAHPKKAA